MTVTTDGRRSCTTDTSGSLPPGAPAPAPVASGVALGRMPVVFAALGVGEPPLAGVTHAEPSPTSTTVRSVRRSALTPELSPRRPWCFGRASGRGAAPPSGRASGLRLDHLADGRGADLEVYMRVGLDLHVPGAGELELLVDALEALLRVRDRVDRPRRERTRWIDGEGDVEVTRLRVHRDVRHVSRVQRLSRGRLLRAGGDRVH